MACLATDGCRIRKCIEALFSGARILKTCRLAIHQPIGEPGSVIEVDINNRLVLLPRINTVAIRTVNAATAYRHFWRKQLMAVSRCNRIQKCGVLVIGDFGLSDVVAVINGAKSCGICGVVRVSDENSVQSKSVNDAID